MGEGACITAGAFGKGARHFSDQEALIAALRQDYVEGMVVSSAATLLVKGSRSMRMERVVEALTVAGDQAPAQGGATLGGGAARGKYHVQDSGAGG